jgi:hypothetical protein
VLRYEHSLKLNVDVVGGQREVQQGDEIVQMVALSRLSSITSASPPLAPAARTLKLLGLASLLKKVTAQSPFNYHFTLLYVLVCQLLPSPMQSLLAWNKLEVKQIQMDSLSYRLLPQLVSAGMFTEAARICTDVIGMHRASAQSVPDHAAKAYQKGNYTQAVKFLKFQQTKVRDASEASARRSSSGSGAPTTNASERAGFSCACPPSLGARLNLILMRSLALACARLRSLALACARLRSLALACARLRSLALACVRLRPPPPQQPPSHALVSLPPQMDCSLQLLDAKARVLSLAPLTTATLGERDGVCGAPTDGERSVKMTDPEVLETFALKDYLMRDWTQDLDEATASFSDNRDLGVVSSDEGVKSKKEVVCWASVQVRCCSLSIFAPRPPLHTLTLLACAARRAEPAVRDASRGPPVQGAQEGQTEPRDEGQRGAAAARARNRGVGGGAVRAGEASAKKREADQKGNLRQGGVEGARAKRARRRCSSAAGAGKRWGWRGRERSER